MRPGLLKWVFLIALVPAAALAAEIVRVTVTLRYRDVRSVLARVSEELGPKGRVTVDGERNRITIEDEANSVKRVTHLLRVIDLPARRFAVGARLDVFPAPAKDRLFKEVPGFVDMTHWMQRAKPRQTFEALLNLQEGGSASAALGPEYGLNLEAGGFDASRGRLAFRSLQLWQTRAARRQMLLAGGATLPEGQTTALVVGAEKENPPLKLEITPSLLPTLEHREVPR